MKPRRLLEPIEGSPELLEGNEGVIDDAIVCRTAAGPGLRIEGVQTYVARDLAAVPGSDVEQVVKETSIAACGCKATRSCMVFVGQADRVYDGPWVATPCPMHLEKLRAFAARREAERMSAGTVFNPLLAFSDEELARRRGTGNSTP